MPTAVSRLASAAGQARPRDVATAIASEQALTMPPMVRQMA